MGGFSVALIQCPAKPNYRRCAPRQHNVCPTIGRPIEAARVVLETLIANHSEHRLGPL